MKTITTVKDPVCGMEVNPGEAAGSLTHGGQTYYFCSTHCLEKFRSGGEKYAIKSTGKLGAVAAGSLYTCPMHPEVRSNKPGACPKCGMANINGCPHCKATIESDLESPSERPSYCVSCGKPFPWTETALTIAQEFTDELEELSTEDKTTLKGTFNDLIVYNPGTEVAVTRFKSIVKKAGSDAREVLTKIFVDLASETIAKLLKG